MSHLSKIKTNISNLDVLKKTLNDIGLYYKMDVSLGDNICLSVYSDKSMNEIICSFESDGFTYSLVADINLWNLGANFNSFYEKFYQKYAYNIVIQQSNSSGFVRVSEKTMEDGSIHLLVQRWH
uniref:Uncharacterized protein ycf35 n=1 Tax=Ptilothamnion sphaericum TaxID=1498216 RepID=A0A4D6WX71_9FLOR|nr:hypothetical protein [Ptilothamnion sphaericum]QCI08344.1 hypothetical protein [Ptilothamnion sphaericum]